MKKMHTVYLNSIFFFLISFIGAAAYAQPSFTSADMPNIGDSDTVLIFSSFEFSHTLDTETGNGYVWDFTDLDLSLYSLFVNIDSYQSKEHDMAEYFPNASIERYTAGTNSINLGYYDYSNDTLLMYRYQAPSAFGWFPPIALMAFPYEFNQSTEIISDFYYGDLKTGERNATTTYDGYGTLKMSNNTYTDVFRIKTVEMDTTFSTQSSITYTKYTWYKQGGQIPLLQLIDGGSPGYYYVYAAKGNGSQTSIPENIELAGFRLYPNPTERKINLDLKNPNEILEISIFNSLGQSLKTYSGFNSQLDISDLKNGLYFIHLKSENEILSQIFLKK